jgi:uridine phosphorylase
VVEQLIALGAPAVISVGTAATITPDLQPGELVLCTKAVRGDGLSHHYLPPGDFVTPDSALTTTLGKALSETGRPVRAGATWTTDALYRETQAEVSLYQRHRVLTAEMEAAGLFAVGQHRAVPVAAAFTVADSLDGDRSHRPDRELVDQGLFDLLSAAEHCLFGGIG